jgi:hypothetical protein
MKPRGHLWAIMSRHPGSLCSLEWELPPDHKAPAGVQLAALQPAAASHTHGRASTVNLAYELDYTL